jgi:membrane protease YdiL (CAAX protease family)
MTNNKIAPSFDVERLIYLLCGMALANYLASNYLRALVERKPQFMGFVYPARVLLIFLLAAAATALCGRLRVLFVRCLDARGKLASVALGLLTGVAVAIFAGLGRNPDWSFQYALLSDPLSAVGITTVLLLVLGLPVAGEAFFRGVVFRALSEHTTTPAAIVGSSVIFVCLWPLYSPAIRLIFAVLMAGLYYRTRSLAAPIVAGVVLNSSLLIAVLYRLTL